MKQKLTELKKETERSVIIVGDFMTPTYLVIVKTTK